MSFSQWLFGMIDNPVTNGRWGLLHILTLIISVSLILAFYFIVKHAKNRERARAVIIYTLAGLIIFLEIMIRIVYFVKLYYYKAPEMAGLDAFWIIIPKPWCAICCWAIAASVFVKRKFFYNYAAITALLCSLIFFAYPGVGFNNQYILFENLYSIVTHALLLISSITLITLGYTRFEYRGIWKVTVALAITFLYGLLEIYVLHSQTDPMYFMPNGDIQAGILHISYGLYLFLYITFILVYVNAFYLVSERRSVKAILCRLVGKKKSADNADLGE